MVTVDYYTILENKFEARFDTLIYYLRVLDLLELKMINEINHSGSHL